MSEVLRLNRDQIYKFVGNDPDTVRVIERLLDKVNTLETELIALEERVEALETP